jgi:hypothetical protein
MTSRSVSRTIQALNDRFVSGTASNNFSHAGVLLHQTDSMDDGETGSGQPWMTSAKHADRFAASIVSKQVPHLYSTSAAGLVLRPSAFQHKDAYWCSYREDGNSMNKGNHGCAGCGPAFPDCVYNFGRLRNMLHDHHTHMRAKRACLWGKPDTSDRSGCQYNELVLNGHAYVNRLPHAVEAWFWPTNGPVHHREGSESRARTLHKRFRSRYNLSSTRCPLLTFNVGEARAGRAPFRRATPTAFRDTAKSPALGGGMVRKPAQLKYK